MLGKDVVSIADLSAEDFTRLLDLTADLKARLFPDPRPLDGKILGPIVQKRSLRTGISFEVGAERLGGRGSVALDRAENRTHAQKAPLVILMRDAELRAGSA